MKKFTLPFIVALAALLFTCPYLMADEEPDYFTITNNYNYNTNTTAQNCTIKIAKANNSYSPNVTIEVRIITANGTVGNWSTKNITSTTAVQLGVLAKGAKMQIRGNNPNGFGYGSNVSYRTAFQFTWTGGTNPSSAAITYAWYYKSGSSTINKKANTWWGVTALSGNIMSLVAYDSEKNSINNDMQLPNSCFYGIFYDILLFVKDAEKLELPGTNLGEYCYSSMFYGATNMTAGPKTLPATTLTTGCYENMFTNCSTLVKAPDIYATTTVLRSCSTIFSGCPKLEYARVYTTSFAESSGTSHWRYWMSGVKSSGVFYCPPQLSRTNRGTNYIPNNWKVYSYDLTFHLQSGAWTDETSEDRQYTWRTDVSDVTTFLSNEVAAGTRFYSDAACTSELTQSYIESQLSELQNTTTLTIYVNGGTAPAGASTYTVTLADDATGYGSVDATEIADVEDEATITIDGNTLTIGTATVTATPTTADAQYTYTFTGWTDGEGNSLPATLTGDLTVVAHFTRTTNTYAIRFLNGETVLQNTQVEYGTTPAYDGSTPTKDADNEYTYTFNAWTPAIYSVDKAQDYTATFTQTKQQYTLTWVTDGNELTGSYTTGTMDWGASITAPDTPTKPGKDFAGWRSSISSNVEDPASTMPTQDLTYTATWTDAAVRTLDLYDDRDATYYNNIKALNDQTYDVTYHRSVKYESDNGNARWYTLCLPFDVDQSQLDLNGLTGKVYEYRYAKGSADENDHVTFHFRAVKSPGYMHAGQGYLVKATGDMGPDFTFTGVTLDTDKDTETNVNALKTNSANAYKESGDIVIVGVLRSGTLRADGKKVMGLANNMIWYPHTNGNPMPAYRAYFYNPSASASVMPRVRIVVEGEDTTELEVVDGELYDAGGDRQAYRAPRKYIRNGVLIIERNGIRYDAQGKRL